MMLKNRQDFADDLEQDSSPLLGLVVIIMSLGAVGSLCALAWFVAKSVTYHT